MKKYISIVLSLFIISSFSFQSFATRYYVKTNGSGNGTSWASASNDLQFVISQKAASGDSIWVAAGTYTPIRNADKTNGKQTNPTDRTNSFVLSNNVKIFGGFNGTETSLSQRNIQTNVTVLSGDLGTIGTTTDNTYHVVISSGNVGTATLDGFTITGGYANDWGSITVNGNSISDIYGGGIVCYSSSPTFKNLIISSNYSGNQGAGIYIAGTSTPTISNITITSNTAETEGGGMYITGTATPVISYTSIASNKAGASGGAGLYNESSSSITITNSTFNNNSTTSSWGSGGGIFNKGTLSLINGLIYKNSSDQNGGGIYSSGTTTLVNNTIVYNNSNANYVVGAGVSGTVTLNNSIIWGNLRSGSTSDNTTGNITYNYCLLESGTLSGTSIISNQIPRFKSVSTDNYRLNGYSPAVNIGSNSLNTTSTDLDGNARIFNAGTIDLGPYEYQSTDTSLPVKTQTMYVKKGGAGTKDGSSWANAVGELSDALKLSYESGVVMQIWVAAGTYTPGYLAGNAINAVNKAFVLQKDVKIYGGFAGTETSLSQRNWKNNVTILSGANTNYHVVISSADAGTATLDGFTITGANGTYSGQITVNGNTVKDEFGGGIYLVSSSPILSNLIVTNNYSASEGAGIYCDASSPTMTNILVYKNNSGQNCAGIYSTSNANPTIINSTIVYNTATSWASGVGLNGSMTIENTIVWGNTTTGSITKKYCLIENAPVITTSQVISKADPQFTDISTDDYTLKKTSPAINIGNNSYVSGVTLDLAGHARIVNSKVDLGAYEYSSNQWTGAVSTDSEDAANWSMGTVLADSEYLEFSSTASNDLILKADHAVGAIVNSSDKNLIVNGKKLSIGGSITFDGTGRIDATDNNSIVELNDTTSQFLNTDVFVNDEFNNLKINNPNGVTVGSDFTIDNTLTINAGSIIIPTTIELNVNGSIVNNVGATGIQIKSSQYEATGSLIFNGTAPQATVEFYSKAQNYAGAKRWQYFTVPVTNVIASPTFTGATIRQWNETALSPTGTWTPQTGTSSLTAGTGYEIYQATPTTYSISGTLTKDDIAKPLTYTIGSPYSGYHIVGNPYTASIDLSQLATSGIGNNLEATIWLYNTGSSAEWKSNSLSSNDFTGNPGQYTAVPLNLAGLSGVEQYIPAMQGFLVKTVDGNPSAGTLTIPYSTTQKNSTMQRAKAAVTEIPCTMASIYDGDAEVDRLWLFTEANCTKNFDNGWDGRKMLSSKTAQIYAIGDDDVYQMSTNADIDNTVIGLTPIAGTSTYTIKFRHNDEDSQQYQKMYFTDLSNGQTFDVTNNNTDITITTENSTSERKFLLTLQRITTFVDNNTADSGVKISSADKQIVINNATDESVNAYIYDIAGRLIGQEKVDAEATVAYSKNIVDQNIVIVKVVSNNVNLSKKLIIE